MTSKTTKQASELQLMMQLNPEVQIMRTKESFEKKISKKAVLSKMLKLHGKNARPLLAFIGTSVRFLCFIFRLEKIAKT